MSVLVTGTLIESRIRILDCFDMGFEMRLRINTTGSLMQRIYDFAIIERNLILDSKRVN